MKILIIDDDKWYNESLAESLRLQNEKDLNIKTVSDPEVSINIIDDFSPDVILLDFNLGSKNALVILNELQSYADTREIPVVVLTDGATKLRLEDLRQYNVKAILNKTTTTPKEIHQCLKV